MPHVPISHKQTLGVILGNRDFFPDALITEARRDLIDALRKALHRARLAHGDRSEARCR